MFSDLAEMSAGNEQDRPVFFADNSDSVGLGQLSLNMVGWAAGFADFDNDGHFDLWVVNGNTLQLADDPTQLAPQRPHVFRQQPPRGFFEIGRQACPRLGEPIVGRGGAHADYDGDGHVDLYVTNYGPNVLYRNVGDGTFEDVARAAGVADDSLSASCAFLDADGDGLLDLYVCGYAQDDGRGASIGAANDRFVYHDARNGGANSLFRNGGNLAFHDVTAPTGLDQNNRRWSFAASWEDYDDDGDQDLYVANDYGRNNLYRNDGGKFVDVAASTGSEDSASGMSAAWGDYDRDGRMDLYVANMFSAAGSRITTQKQFKTGTREEIRDRFRRFARGNTLFRNTGEGFEDVSVQAGVTLGRWAWSSNFVDLNNDSWEDLVVGNGYYTREDTGDL